MPPRARRGSAEAEAGVDANHDHDAASLVDEFRAWEKDAESALDRRLRDHRAMTKMVLEEALQNPDWTFSEVESKLKDGAAAYRLLQDVELRRIKDKRDKLFECILSQRRAPSAPIAGISTSFPSNLRAIPEVSRSEPPPGSEVRVLRTPRRGASSQAAPGTPTALLKRSISQVSPTSEPASPTKKKAKPLVATSGTQASTAPRTITFDEVYQGGNPKHWHSIVRYPDISSGKWYILKCQSPNHVTHFGNHRALQGAAKHLNGSAHRLERRQDVAVRELGVEVLQCNEELARKNNAAFDDALKNGYEILNTLSKGTKWRPPAAPPRPLAPAPKSSRGKFIEGVTPPRLITRPEPGGLYYAYWRDDDKYYLVMVLRWRDNDKCGLPELANGLSGLGLLKAKVRSPGCYVLNKEKTKILGWADGFKDGEDYETEREFPVLFIQDSPCKASWVEASDLAHYDHDDPKYDHELFDVKEHRAEIAREAYARGRGYKSYEKFRTDYPTVPRPDDMLPSMPEEISPATPSSRPRGKRLSVSESVSDGAEDGNDAVDEDGDENMAEAPPVPSVPSVDGGDLADKFMAATPLHPSTNAKDLSGSGGDPENANGSQEVKDPMPAANTSISTVGADDVQATKSSPLGNDNPSAENDVDSSGDTRRVPAPVGQAGTGDVAIGTPTQSPAMASHPEQPIPLYEQLQTRRRFDHMSPKPSPLSNIRESLSCVHLTGYETKGVSWKASSGSEHLRLDLDPAASVARAAPGQAVPVELHPARMISVRTTAVGAGDATVTVTALKGQGGIVKSTFQFGEREAKTAMQQAQEFEAWVKAVKEACVKAAKQAKEAKEVKEAKEAKNGKS